MSALTNNVLLQVTVETGVLLRIQELKQLGLDEVFAEVDARRHEWVDLIASKADILLYGGGKPGDVARVHTALVEALAHLAFVPGGVEFMGIRFDANPVPADGLP